MGLGTSYTIKGTNEETIELTSVMGEETIEITTKDDSFYGSSDYYSKELFNLLKEKVFHVFMFDYANSWGDYTRGSITKDGDILKIKLESQNGEIDTEMTISEFIEPD